MVISMGARMAVFYDQYCLNVVEARVDSQLTRRKHRGNTRYFTISAHVDQEKKNKHFAKNPANKVRIRCPKHYHYYYGENTL